MEHREGVEGSKFPRHGGSRYAGAILMSNLATKQECLQRKLFGLPSSKAQFIMQIKAGNLLFLFEHEERKLFGVFEATSDGALNIVPDAFLSSGRSFPAQVLFKRIWMCKPVSEDEFHDAIKDNYFAPHKFNFGLSHDQVMKLLELFSLKKINIVQYQRPGISNEIIRKFEKSVGNTNRTTGRGGFMKFASGGYSRNDGRSSQRYLDGSGSDPHSAMSSRRKQSSFVNSGLRPRALVAKEAWPTRLLRYGSKQPNLTGSTYANDPSNSGSFSEHSVNMHHGPPNLMWSSLPIQSPSSSNFEDYRPVPHTECHGPSNHRILSLPGMPMAKGTEGLPSVNPRRSHGYSEASIDEVESGDQPCEKFTPFDRIPLPGTNCFDKDIGRLLADRTQKDSSFNYYSGCVDDDDLQRMRPYSATHVEEEYYPVTPKSKLRSDTEQTRISVFSRLTRASDSPRSSRTPEACGSLKTPVTSGLSRTSEKSHLSKSQEAVHGYQAQEQVTSVLLDQYPGLLSSKRELEMIEAPKRSNTTDDDTKFKSIMAREPHSITSPRELEADDDVLVEDAADEDETAKDTAIEGSSEHLILNLKHTSDTQSFVGENKNKVYVESCLDEGTPQNKKRKLLKPSFISEEECRDAQNSSREVGFSGVIENGGENISSDELSSTIHGDLDEKNNSASEASLCYVASDRTDKNSATDKNPAFSEEECRDDQNSSREIGFSGVIENGGKNNSSEEISSTIHGDLDEKNNPASEGSLCYAASDKSDKNSESLKNSQPDENKNSPASETGMRDDARYKTKICSESLTPYKREVSNKNLLWFLQKTMDGKR